MKFIGQTAKILVATSLFGYANAKVERDIVKTLPGWPHDHFPSTHYSGYLNITETKHLHYYFVESENDPANDPVVLWLNGGPGCSSMDGLLYEHGPYRVNTKDNSKLERFEYTWAKMANMIYLEAPVGVGFSYSDNEDEYNVDDDSTAHDNLLAVEKFFELYPEFKDRPFYITGESYGGVYVPTLAEAIMFADQKGEYSGPKLEGIAVGNGCTGTEVGTCGAERDKFETEYLLGQAFIDPELKKLIVKECDFSASSFSSQCTALLERMYNGIGNINMYNIYGECPGPMQAVGLKAPLGQNLVHSKFKGPVECLDSIDASNWINRPEVFEALHVKPPSFEWATCANRITYTQTRPNLPRDTYPDLIKYTNVLIYNGDWDACVPWTDNYSWTSNMNLHVNKPWHPWIYTSPTKGGGQVGGYAISYHAKHSFQFITIRGGRHEVPETAPVQAFEVIKRFLNGETF